MPEPRHPRPDRSVSRSATAWLAAIGIVLVALNLRPAVTSLGALLDEVRTGLGLNGLEAGIATTLPVIAFATIGSSAPLIARTLGLVPGIVIADLMLAIGLGLRAFTAQGPWSLLVWTAVATAGIAVTNVLLPSVVRAYFPNRLGAVTGFYTMALQLGSASAAGISVPLADVFGSWRGGLGFWALLALIAAPPWIIVWRHNNKRSDDTKPDISGSKPRLGRNSLAVALAVFFGMQSLSAYVIMGWLPQIYRDAGVSPTTAGWLLAVVMAVAAPMALAMPVAAHKLRDQRGLVAVVTAALAVGYTGLMIAPAAGAVLWSAFLGIGSGAFPLALGLIGLRARNTATTTALSAFAQSGGYLLAAAGPFVIGVIHQLSGGWVVPLVVLLGLLVPQVAGGLIAGTNRYVDDTS